MNTLPTTAEMAQLAEALLGRYWQLSDELKQNEEAAQWRNDHESFVRKFEEMIAAQAVAQQISEWLWGNNTETTKAPQGHSIDVLHHRLAT